jgi:hypothetical protein
VSAPSWLELEIAAARLAAGYHDANDTADDLANPHARAAIDFMLECDRVIDGDGLVVLAIPDDAGWLGDLVRLYLEIVDDPGG